MPVTYEQLKKDQQCIYQAFQNVKGNSDTPSAMGKYVNDRGFDADDDAAVDNLAEKYGFDQVEMFLGKNWNDGTYNLEQGCEYILSIYTLASAIAEFQKVVKDSIHLKGLTSRSVER